MPIFGICRGIQILNVALGGTLYQDIDSDHYSTKLIKHMQQAGRSVATHYVQIIAENLLATILEQEKIAVNSFHHQSVNVLAENLKVAAKSSDGIIEAVVHEELPFCLAVQWHPEELAIAGDPHAQKLFAAFIEASIKFKKRGLKGRCQKNPIVYGFFFCVKKEDLCSVKEHNPQTLI
ncbi:gamma-glutamyl-gamma-aminobutyrate hydrolase family protein [Lysinibacillus sp. MHQ-1]|nr:gamma-glutamyl-gamma-aminobutyrate hydrolase family protein [Lysinibacillus sp. MHQ-1]